MKEGTADALPWVWGETVGSVLEQTAGRHAEQDALVFPQLNLRWSWRELNDRVNLAAEWLIELGVTVGEHIGIWSMNVPEWIVTQFAAGRIGAVLVNVNPAYRVHELSDALRMADVATLVVGSPFKGSNFVAMVESLCPEVAHALVSRLALQAVSPTETVDRAGRPSRARLVDVGRRRERPHEPIAHRSRPARRSPPR